MKPFFKDCVGLEKKEGTEGGAVVGASLKGRGGGVKSSLSGRWTMLSGSGEDSQCVMV